MGRTIFKPWLVILPGLLGVMSGCSTIRSELEQNQQLWRSHNLQHYRYIFQKRCFCPPPANLPVQIVVEQERIIAVTEVRDRQPVANAQAEVYKTVDELFEIIATAQRDRQGELTVKYHPDLGYPTQIDIDRIQAAVDDEVAYFISDLAAIHH
jgi:hypothetical protein